MPCHLFFCSAWLHPLPKPHYCSSDYGGKRFPLFGCQNIVCISRKLWEMRSALFFWSSEKEASKSEPYFKPDLDNQPLTSLTWQATSVCCSFSHCCQHPCLSSLLIYSLQTVLLRNILFQHPAGIMVDTHLSSVYIGLQMVLLLPGITLPTAISYSPDEYVTITVFFLLI